MMRELTTIKVKWSLSYRKINKENSTNRMIGHNNNHDTETLIIITTQVMSPTLSSYSETDKKLAN